MNYEELKDTNLAFASKVFKNNGSKNPISVMFECFSPNGGATAHQRMLSKALGSTLSNRKTFLMNYSSETFEESFGKFGFKAEDITGDYSTAKEVNLTVKEIYGEDLILRRVDTTDSAVVKDAEGRLKPQWQIKRVNGVELTHEGALIYSTVEFAEPGTPDLRIKQDQDASMLNGVKQTDMLVEANVVADKAAAVKSAAMEEAVTAPF
jgi:hypothetical protein